MKLAGASMLCRQVHFPAERGIYARVSTTDQSCARQRSGLEAFALTAGFEVIGVFIETAPGMKANCTERNRIMELAQAREIDAVLVTELSRWGRSTQDLHSTLSRFAS